MYVLATCELTLTVIVQKEVIITLHSKFIIPDVNQ